MKGLRRQPPYVLAGVFALVSLVTAFGLVYTKHESRKLFVELEDLTRERDELNIEWGQLQIEQSTWSTHGRIEQVANDSLNLVKPAPDDVYVIERQ